MSLYTDLIHIDDEYNYSANIQFDIENDKRLMGFVPSEASINLIREYFLDMSRSKPERHARILYGSYGTGKSHFLTVLSLLLSKTYTDSLAYETFLSKVKMWDEYLAADIDSYIKNESIHPALIVPIIFDFADFNRSIFFSLKRKLETLGINVNFKSFYDEALRLIDVWESSEDSLQRLDSACKKRGTSIDSLKEKLNYLDVESERVFHKVFSDMTFGVKFVYEVSSLSDAIAQVNEKIKEQYSGIVFIFDEFGRYIEDNIKEIKVKSIQDLAEFCDHSDGNNHIILVSHKEISQYTQRFGSNVADEWKKIEGRYKPTPINDYRDQCLALVNSVIVKKEDVWNAFKLKFRNEINELYGSVADFKGFTINSLKDSENLMNSFPLHPMSLYALDKLSKKVAQNERTFFTYLASKDENSLFRFLASTDLNEFHYIGIDKIYDYFEPSIKAVQSDAGFGWYRQLQLSLSKLGESLREDSAQIKILKAICLIGIIGDSSVLQADKKTLITSIDVDNNSLSDAIDYLCEKKIIKYSGAYNRYDFFESSIYDVEGLIEEGKSSISDTAMVNTLNEEFINFVVYPYRYNRRYKISRVFVPLFMPLSDVGSKVQSNKIQNNYDGAVIMLLGDYDTKIEDILEYSKEINRSIIYLIRDSREIEDYISSYISIKYLEGKKEQYAKNDPAFEKELNYYKNEYFDLVSNAVLNLQTNISEDAVIISDGNVYTDVKSFDNVSELASEVMYKHYPSTMIVNNELINKNIVSGTMRAAKRTALNAMIQGNDEKSYYGLTELSPEYIIVRSVLAKNGFIEVCDSITLNEMIDSYRPQDNVKKFINEKIKEAKYASVKFDEIINVLKGEPYGLRNGYLSIMLLNMILPYKKSLIVDSHGSEQEITAELFEEIVRRPHDFSFTVASWNQNQLDYLDSLEQLYDSHINVRALAKNRLKAIVDGMLAHYRSLPKFARTSSDYASDDAISYRKTVEKTGSNYSTFLFSKLHLPSEEYSETIKRVKEAKQNLEMATLELSKDVCRDTLLAIKYANENISLAKAFQEIYAKEWKEKRAKSFDFYTNSFLQYVENIKPDMSDWEVLNDLAKILTGFEVNYWSDSQKGEFIEKINEIVGKLEEYKPSENLRDLETKITLSSANGTEKSIVFERNELNDLSETLKRRIQSSINSFGLALSYDEKIQVVFSVLEDLMKGE